jgi:3-hydroxyacyl-CoA dehydrogenase/enoyl-CoA hydratase/3-hydroxybutyryl-CoA epimerase
MINKIVVIGSGVMGSAIASLIASSGREVLLLDIGDASNNAIERLKSIRPAALTSLDYLPLITPGTIEKDLEKINNADLVIEVIIENLEIKRQLYSKIEKLMGEDTIISSNTSTIKLSDLLEGRSDRFRNNFVITHFFNPPRYMKLLELVVASNTSESAIAKVSGFLINELGKEVVVCNDTPGFIANRIGCFFIERAIEIAMDNNKKYPQDSYVSFFDQALCQVAGLPKTGVFGLADLIGLDVMKLISKSLTTALPKDDAYQKINLSRPMIDNLISNGFNGRKGKGGFYKLEKKDGKSEMFILDLDTGEHKKLQKNDLNLHDLGELLQTDNPNLQAVWQSVEDMLLYTLNIAEEIATSIYDIDRAIKQGYNWKWGPFEMIDKIGAGKLINLLNSKKIPVPKLLHEKSFYNNGSYLAFDGQYIKIPVDKKYINLNDQEIILSNQDSRLLNLGDGVLCFEILTKMNVLTEKVFQLLQESVQLANNGKYRGMIIGDNDKNFCAGANLSYFYQILKVNDHASVRRFLELGQETMLSIKYSSVPIVATLKGVALGGGCELLLHVAAICAHVEGSFGLVETKVGLLPGWGGIKEFYLRNKSVEDKEIALNSILEARVFDNAEMLKKVPFNIENIKVIFNEQHLLFQAKEMITDNDIISKRIKYVEEKQDFLKEMQYTDSVNDLCTKLFKVDNLSEDNLLNIEKELFAQASKQKDTISKIEKVIYTRRPSNDSI